MPLVGGPHIPGRVSLGGLTHGLELVLSQAMGKAGVQVKVRCISPGPWGMGLYPMWG